MARAPRPGRRRRGGRIGRGTGPILARALLPGGVVLLGVVGLLALGGDELLRTLTEGYALLLYGVGMALAAYFHRSRVVIAILGLGLLDLFGARIPGGEAYLMASGGVGLVLLGTLTLPADRGILSLGGLVQAAGVAVVVGPPVFLLRDPDRLRAFVETRPVPGATLPWPFEVPQAVVLLGAAGALLAAVGVYRRSGSVERGLAWSLLFVAAAMAPATSGPAASLLVMAAALTLSLSVLEASYHMAYRDELTGLPARRALMRELSDLRGVYTLAMVDVDRFKGFNDRHGHEVGDQVLRMVAAGLEKPPGGGRAYRYGGEEFTLVFPGRGTEETMPFLEEVRRRIEEARFTVRSWTRPKKKPPAGKGGGRTARGRGRKRRRPKGLSVTVSIGAADSSGDEATSESVLKNADTALYRAKKKGRNRVEG